jgi:hypothetical protein
VKTSLLAGSGTGIAIHGTSYSNNGVRGVSTAGNGIRVSEFQVGVYGEGTNAGVSGHASSGNGVYGSSQSGNAVFAQTFNSAAIALRSQGRVSFDRSGVATIAAGSTSKTVTPTYGVPAGSFVLLTPKTNLGGRDLWFTTDATANTFTIRVSRPRSSGIKVAWLLLG